MYSTTVRQLQSHHLIMLVLYTYTIGKSYEVGQLVNAREFQYNVFVDRSSRIVEPL